ncbi:MAG: YihY/virulence factor BrkB family protein [Melioribacteraceae bacterium]|nr:YihY/virulence factor BrkB family protein [Melioribacteraceae bacterium]MCF8356128.1 YihY/virulence factor BrkB family protein [Melioribacteraceae bacterium]MCF8395476.1 YihY/virulence factor BrkB family protein [Melioribacteraceae bacterium]MCF8420816.1 YihY/virulence factor BrkB family protein [Melioribacteraceae bacterium]
MSRFSILRKITTIISPDHFRRITKFISHYFGGLFLKIDKHHLFLAAAGIAYSLILSMIPMMLILFAILGNVIDVQSIETQVTNLIDTVIPYPQYAEYAKTFIMKRIPEVVQYKTLVGYFGAFGLLFTSTWLFSSMRTILNNIFGVAVEKSAWIGLLRDFGMVILLIVFILLLTVVFPMTNFLLNAADKVEFLQFLRISELLETILSISSLIILFFMFFLFYKLIPYDKLGKRVPLVGALWATILWEVAKTLFGYYVSNFLSINKMYGAFILVIVLLFWIFYSSILFLIGAEIAQLYRERKLERERLRDLVNSATFK